MRSRRKWSWEVKEEKKKKKEKRRGDWGRRHTYTLLRPMLDPIRAFGRSQVPVPGAESGGQTPAVAGLCS